MNTGNDWKADPRLSSISQEKLDYITAFADRIAGLPKEQLMPAFLSMQAETAKSGIRFNNKETDVLVSVLSARMSPAERKKLETLRILAGKLGKG